MSNPTTPFSWQMPTATDLVTDLPADFEVFGQAVATSMADLLGGSSGYILSKASATDMDFTWIANDQGDITGITAGTGISVTSPTGPVPTVAIDTAVTVDKTTAQTLTNKTIDTATNTITGAATLTGSETLTNKTLTSPALTTPTISTLTTNGDLLYGTGSGALARRGIGSTSQVLTVSGGLPTWQTPASAAPTSGNASVLTFQTTTSTSYVDLATSGPACTVTTGTKALVIFGANENGNAAAVTALMDFAVSGATTRAATDDTCLMMTAPGVGNNQYASSRGITITGLTAGSNTFTCKYRQAGGTGQFGNRFITVIDLGS